MQPLKPNEKKDMNLTVCKKKKIEECSLEYEEAYL